jgi:hypothetical protein
MVVHTRQRTPVNARTSTIENENNPINANAAPILYKKSERAGQKRKTDTRPVLYVDLLLALSV